MRRHLVIWREELRKVSLDVWSLDSVRNYVEKVVQTHTRVVVAAGPIWEVSGRVGWAFGRFWVRQLQW